MEKVFPKEEGRPKKKLDYDYCLSWMVNADETLICSDSKRIISELIGELNKYLHTSGLKRMEIGKSHCPGCPSLVSYEEDEYKRCVGLFQDVTTLLIQVFYTYLESGSQDKCPSEDVLNAVGHLKTLEQMEKRFKIKLIFSEQLRIFLSKEEFQKL